MTRIIARRLRLVPPAAFALLATATAAAPALAAQCGDVITDWRAWIAT